MRKIKTFVSFDYHHDGDLLHDLVVESHQTDSPLEIEDWSLHEDLTGDWEKKVSARMHEMELLIALCGEQTSEAPGVTAELWMAQRARVPYFLLAAGRIGPARNRAAPGLMTSSTTGPGPT